MKIGKHAVPNIVMYGLGVLVVVVAAWLLWPSGEDENIGTAPAIELPANITGSAEFAGQIVPTSDNAYYVGGRWIAKPAPVAPTAETPALPVTVSEIPVADQTANEDEPEADEPVDEPEDVNTEKKIVKLSVFEDWVDGDLSLKDTDIADFIVFKNKKAVEDFVDEYRWNDKHDFTWNVDEMAIQFANDYGDSDPAPAAFATTGTNSNIYFVALSDDEITPEFYQLDSAKDSKAEVIEKKSGEKTVYPIDQWETEDL